MRANKKRNNRHAIKRAQKIVGLPLKQFLIVGFYLNAYLRIFVRPKIKNVCRTKSNGTLITVILAGFNKHFVSQQPAIAAHLEIHYQKYWHSFYWLHAGDPFAI